MPRRLPGRRARLLGAALLTAAAPLVAPLAAQQAGDLPAATAATPGPFDGPSPWPAIRRARIAQLLPAAMREASADAWVILLRENANDPLALHVGGENAGAPSAVLFFRVAGPTGDDRVRSVMLAGFGEAIALRELALHDSVVVTEGGVAGLERAIAERLAAADPARIAVNSGGSGVADGLSWTQRTGLERALGPTLAARLVSAEPMVRAWLAVKLPEEVAIMRRAAALTVQLEEEAYATIVPGVTRDRDLAAFLKRRMRELGVEDGWSPAQNPSVNSGPDRGHSHASDRVIQPGDVIQTDFGIKVHGVWVTDIQRFAYVLRAGETAAPPEVERRWRHAVAGGRAAFDAMRPGVTGAQVDSAQRLVMTAARSLPVPWGTGHAVGYWAHDVGPGLNRRETRTLAVGHVLAFDGFHAWAFDERAGAAPAWGAGTKTISVEEMAVVTSEGAEYLVPPQERLILVPARAELVADGALAAGASAYNPSQTPDGRTLVFARSAPGFRQPVIHVTRLVGSEWTVPTPVPFADARWGDSDPTLTPDGRTLYFISDRAAAGADGRDSTRRDFDVWRVRREPTPDGERWGMPERLGPEVNTRNQELGPTWRDGVLYFASARRAGVGGLDLYAARELGDGRFAPAALFGGALNTPASESDPEFSPDGRTLLFWSDRPGGVGSADLYAARRLANGDWSDPLPLRGAANSAWFDFTPSYAPDGRWLYFASDRPVGPAGSGAPAVPSPSEPVAAGEGPANVWRVRVATVLP